MNKANKFGLFAIVVALLAFTAGWAAADVSEESISGFYGHAYLDISNGTLTWDNAAPSPFVGTDVYKNTASAANFGFSSTDLASTFGDRVTTAGTGILEENDFTLYNSSSSVGPLLTATVNINLYNATTTVGLGGYSTSVNFGTGLPAGFFSVVTVVGLSGLNINVNTTDVLITQQISAKTGTANRLGVASMDPPTVGSSANTMFISSSTVGGGVPGYYTVGSPPANANPGYRINVNVPVPTQAKSWGSVKADYR